MHKIDDISSILDAVNDINLKSKKISNTIASQNSIPKLNQDLIIPLDIDKIISEAEEYKKKSFKTHHVDLIQEKNDILKSKNYNKNLEEIQSQIIEDLYSKFKKKIKKNTLKIIFNLHLKIKDLEKKLENFQAKKKQTLNKNKLILKDEFVESLDIPDPSIIELNKTLSTNLPKDEIIKTLQIQDSTIDILNEKIKKFINTEEKLRSQIIDLEQDKTLLLNKVKKFDESKDYKNIISDTNETLKTIYRQVEKQKKIFLELRNFSIKTERDFNFYKENYEKLIIENNDIKKKLTNTKQQVEAFEEIKKELAYIFENFNNVLSKNSIIKLNESFSKINSNPSSLPRINKEDK